MKIERYKFQHGRCEVAGLLCLYTAEAMAAAGRESC